MAYHEGHGKKHLTKTQRLVQERALQEAIDAGKSAEKPKAPVPAVSADKKS